MKPLRIGIVALTWVRNGILKTNIDIWKILNSYGRHCGFVDRADILTLASDYRGVKLPDHTLITDPSDHFLDLLAEWDYPTDRQLGWYPRQLVYQTYRNKPRGYVPMTEEVLKQLHRDYDLLVFPACGDGHEKNEIRPYYADIVEGIKLPFIALVHSETELGVRFKWNKLFFNHPKLFAVGMPSPNLVEYHTKKGNFADKWRFVFRPSCWWEDTPLNPLRKFILPDRDPKSIIHTANWLSCKGTDLLARQAPALKSAGFNVKLYGNCHVWTFKDLVKELAGDSVDYPGPYDQEDVYKICAAATFHHNFWYYSKREYTHRIENATLEAIKWGCVPIINREIIGTSEDITADDCIPLSVEGHAELPQILNSLSTSDCERINANARAWALRAYDPMDQIMTWMKIFMRAGI